jgi:hypothetical protein
MFPFSLLALVSLTVSSVLAGSMKDESDRTNLVFLAKVNSSGFINLPKADRARAACLRSQADAAGKQNEKRDSTSLSMNNSAATYTSSEFPLLSISIKNLPLALMSII